jgi:hypothetical protein
MQDRLKCVSKNEKRPDLLGVYTQNVRYLNWHKINDRPNELGRIAIVLVRYSHGRH